MTTTLETAHTEAQAAVSAMERETLTRDDVKEIRNHLRRAAAAIESLECAMRLGKEPKQGE